MTSHKNEDNLTPRNEDDLRQKCLLYSCILCIMHIMHLMHYAYYAYYAYHVYYALCILCISCIICIMHIMLCAYHACYEVSCISCILYIQNMCFWAFFRQKTDKIGQFKKIGGEKGRKSVNYLKIKEELICRNSPNKKKEKKCQFWKSLGRGYLSEQSQQK